ncbi:MAG: DUF5107 domain-containing protein [Armatimonadetes bacterium]|nr:DUF5107 domain-containing protein [Armatimonadota bacterium]
MSARVWEETITMPTYPVGKASPFPPFDRSIYPYPMLDDIGYDKVDKNYRAVMLENDYLKVTVLPEIGGKIWGVWDKIARRDMFYSPKVVKPGLVSLRGAWTAGGIEFNFPIGHHVYCMSPMHYLPVQEPGGRATVWVYQYEYLSGMHWAVAISLSPGVNRVETTIRLHNASDMPQRYYVWSNSAVPVSHDFEFICTAPSTSDGRSFPIDNGLQVSLYRNLDHALDLFARNPQDDYFGYYDAREGYGVLNVANRFEAVGQKLFTWGTGEDGLIWAHLLSDSDLNYCEVQRGRFEDQGTWRMIMPQAVEQWSEVWFPVHGVGKPVKATRDGVIGIESRDGQTRAGVQVVTDQKDAAISVEAGGVNQWKHRGTLTPVEAVTHTVDAADSLLTISVTGPAFEKPIEYSSEPKEIVPPVAVDSDKEPETAEEYARAAVRAWQRRNDAQADELWARALEQDPGFVPALLAQARRNRWRGQDEKAEDLVRQALARDPENPEALYYEGSLEGLFKAFRHPAWKAAAALEIALRYPKYAYTVEVALKANATNPFLYARQIKILRDEGRAEEADACLSRFLEYAPYDLIALAQKAFHQSETTGSLPADLEARLKDSPESAMGLIPFVDASRARLLAEWACLNGVGVRAPYIFEYWYPGEKLTSAPAKGPNTVLPADSVFPHRQEEIAVYRHYPEDAAVQYLTGLWLYGKGLKEEGVAAWEKAEALGLQDGTLFRCLGWACWKDRGDREKAVAMYEKSLALMPENYRLYADRNAIWGEMGKPASERLAALESAPTSVRDRWQMAALRAELCVAVKNYDKAIELLGSHTFLPWEGARGMRGTYLNAHLGRARKHFLAGDFVGTLEDFKAALQYPMNLGVGRMNPPFRYESEEHFWAGMGYMATGHETEAMALWQEALSQLARHGSRKPVPDSPQAALEALTETARPDERAHASRERFREGFAAVAAGNASRAYSIFSEAVREDVWPW